MAFTVTSGAVRLHTAALQGKLSKASVTKPLSTTYVPARQVDVRAAKSEEAGNPSLFEEEQLWCDGGKCWPANDSIDDNVIEYCNLDSEGKRPQAPLTLAEKEAEFLKALQSFYFENKPTMSNEEFDLLKEELQWEGSKVVVLSKDELKFMEAALAFNAGKPIMADAEYDAIKNRLKQQGSRVVTKIRSVKQLVRQLEEKDFLLTEVDLKGGLMDALPGDTCNANGGAGKSEGQASPDFGRMLLINTPVGLVSGVATLAATTLGGADLAVGAVAAGVGALVGAKVAGNFIMKDALILTGECPNCGTESTSYFGDLLTVEGKRDVNLVECTCCKAKLEFNAENRTIVIKTPPPAIAEKVAA